MQGPIATIGHNHTCPMYDGKSPHVGGAIVKSGAPGVTIDGKPIALMGDTCTCSGPPDMIAQGSAGVTVGGVPVATLGCMTAHGGVIVEGVPGVTITSNAATPTQTMPASKIPFPEFSFLTKVLGNTAAARDSQQQLREAAPQEQETEEPRVVTLSSTYPLDELTEFTKQFGASFFNFGMQGIFSDANEKEENKIPMHAYDYLYRDLSEGSVTMPEIIVDRSAFRYAEYKSDDNTIAISEHLILQATEEEDIDAMGKLHQALLEEFGHFIDWQLRTHYTSLGGDTPKDEGAVFGYCLTTLNIFEATEILFGEATVDGTVYPLRIDLSELQQQIDDLVTQERIQRDAQSADSEYFGAGMQTFEEAGGYTHFGIEEVLNAENILEDKKDLSYIYLGNLLRDWSQLITPSTERYSEAAQDEIACVLGLSDTQKQEFFGMQFLNPIKLSRSHLAFVIELIAAHELVGKDLNPSQIGAGRGNTVISTATSPKKATETAATATEETSGITDWIKEKATSLGITAIEWCLEYQVFCRHYPKLTPAIIGVYKPQEHIDNPVGAAVVDRIKEEYLYWPPEVDPEINPYYGMKNYIRSGTKGKPEAKSTTQSGIYPKGYQLPTTTAYIEEQLRSAYRKHQEGQHKTSLLHFGNALHTIEDFFAHSNFIELALIKNGYAAVIPWIDRKSPKALAFNKIARTERAFEERNETDNQFDRSRKIKTYTDIEQLYREYPEARHSGFVYPKYFIFEHNGQSYEYVYTKKGKEGGTLYLVATTYIIEDRQRPGPYLNHLPIVTGKFGPLDMIHSLLDKVETMFEGHKFTWKDLISSETEGKPYIRILDLVVLTILSDLKHAQATERTKEGVHRGLDYAQLIEYYEYIIQFRGVVLGILEAAKRGKGWLVVGAWAAVQAINALEQVLMNVVKHAIRFVIAGVASGIKIGQNFGELGTNPTHSQVAKDDMQHPLHQLAGTLARNAVADIGQQFVNAKKGRTNMETVIKIAKAYIAHPADVDWMDLQVQKWATTHIGEVHTAKSKDFIHALHQEHEEHLHELIEQRNAMLEIINEGMEQLENLAQKAKDMQQDLDFTKKAKKTIKDMMNLFERWTD